MALPIGTFSHPDAGVLRVVFGGKWTLRRISDAGFRDPFQRVSALELLLRAYVDDGLVRRTALLSTAVSTAVIDIDYPGGYAPVDVGFEYVSHSYDGISAIFAAPLSIACHLTQPIIV